MTEEQPSILVIDDTPGNLSLLNQLLREHYRVKLANSGPRGLELAAMAPPDLILLDIMMPGISGLEICRRLKANPDRRRIPIIFVTAMSSTEDERRGLEIGAVDYITKPISPPIVMARVRTHLALYDQSRELAHMVAQRTTELLTTRQQIIRRLGERTAGVPGITAYMQPVQDLTVEDRVSRTQYQYTLEDASADELNTYASRLVAKLRTLPELRDVATDQQTQGAQARLVIGCDGVSDDYVVSHVVSYLEHCGADETARRDR